MLPSFKGRVQYLEAEPTARMQAGCSKAIDAPQLIDCHHGGSLQSYPYRTVKLQAASCGSFSLFPQPSLPTHERDPRP